MFYSCRCQLLLGLGLTSGVGGLCAPGAGVAAESHAFYLPAAPRPNFEDSYRSPLHPLCGSRD